MGSFSGTQGRIPLDRNVLRDAVIARIDSDGRAIISYYVGHNINTIDFELVQGPAKAERYQYDDLRGESTWQVEIDCRRAP